MQRDQCPNALDATNGYTKAIDGSSDAVYANAGAGAASASLPPTR